MNNGNSGLEGIEYYAGSPLSVSTNILNAPRGSLILNTASGGIPKVKTSVLGDNSGVDDVVLVAATQTLTNKTLTNPTISDGTASRFIKTDVVAISGTALHAANLTIWTAPASAIILRVLLDITTQSTGASTIDIGYTAASATTSSDTLLDGVSGAAAALFDSMNAALDSGANALAQKAASGKWITADEASGDTTALVGNVYISYILA